MPIDPRHPQRTLTERDFKVLQRAYSNIGKRRRFGAKFLGGWVIISIGIGIATYFLVDEAVRRHFLPEAFTFVLCAIGI